MYMDGVYVGMDAVSCVWRHEDIFVEFVDSFLLYMGSGD